MVTAKKPQNRLAGIATVLGIIASLLGILQFFGVTKFQCFVGACANSGQNVRTTEMAAVESLVPGVNIGIYTGKFGQPVFINHNQASGTTKASTEYVFIGHYFYVDALTDPNDNVLYFAVTTRDKSFNPVFKSPGYPQNMPSFQMTLGVTTFATLQGSDLSGTTQLLAGCTGTRTFAYYEMNYLGNPGDYENFAFGVNTAGYFNARADVSIITNNQSYCAGISAASGGDTQQALQTLQTFRSQELINTYAVSSPDAVISDYVVNANLGVNPDQVRTLNP